MAEPESELQDLSARAAKAAAECQQLLSEIFRPRSKQALAEIEELRQAGVSESRIESLYPLALIDYVRGAEIISDDSRLWGILWGGILWGSAALEDVGDVQYRLRPEYAQQIRTQREDPALLELGSNFAAALATVQLLNSASLPQVTDDFQQGDVQKRDALVIVHWLEAFGWVLFNLRREQLILNEGDPLRRLLFRWRNAWAGSALQTFAQRLRSGAKLR